MIAAFVMTVSPVIEAWQGQTPQTGIESLPQTYKGTPLPNDPADCGVQLAEKLWGLKAPKSKDPKSNEWTNFDPRDNFDIRVHAKPFVTFTCTSETQPEGDLLIEPIIVHASMWQMASDKNWSEVFSQWQVYRNEKNLEGLLADGYQKPASTKIQPSLARWPAKPALYNDKAEAFVGLSCFYDQKGKPLTNGDELSALALTYKIGITEVIPDNINDVNELLGKALGTKASTTTKTLTEENGATPNNLIEIIPQHTGPMPCIMTFAHLTIDNLPSDIKFTLTLKDSKAPAKPSAKLDVPAPETEGGSDSALSAAPEAAPLTLQPAIARTSLVPPLTLASFNQAVGPAGGGGGGGQGDKPSKSGQQKNTVGCSSGSSGCNGDHTIRAWDMEWWDLGLGLNIPGTKEPQYASGTPPRQTTPKTLTGVYGFANFYPFASLGDKTSYYPSLVGGIPVTGQVFYQPFVGLAENITGWKAATRWLPFQVNLVAGIVFLKQQEALSNAQGSLQVDHVYVRKFMFGVELPVSSLLSKIKSVAGSGNANNSGNKSESASGN